MKFFAAASKNQCRSRVLYKPEQSPRSQLTCTPQIMCLKRDTASWCKSRARGFRSMIATLRNLYPIFLKPRPAIIKRPRSTSTVPKAIRRAWKFRHYRQGSRIGPRNSKSYLLSEWGGGGGGIEALAPNMNTSYPDFGPSGSYWTRGLDGSWDYGLRDCSLKASLST